MPKAGTLCWGLLVLGLIRTASAQDAAEWSRRLGAPDLGQRREAAYQLGRIGPGAKEALPALVKAVDDPDKQVWSLALTAIANLGPAALPALPDLLRALDGHSGRAASDRERLPQLQIRVGYALSRLGAGARPALIEALHSPDAGVRQGAACGLGGMGPDAAEAVPALMVALTDSNPEVVREARDALGAIGTPALKPLQEALASPDSRVRAGAVIAIGQVGAPAQGAAPALFELFDREGESSVRIAVLGALPKIKAPPERLVPLLLNGVKDDQEALRHAAINAIVPLRSGQKLALEGLVAMLADPKAPVRQRAARALGRMGSEAAAAIPALLAASSAAPADGSFADALSQIGPAALPALRTALNGPARPDGERLVAAVASFGEPAVPCLLDTLHHPDVRLRRAAESALAAMGAAAHVAIAPLFARAAESDPAARAAALRALVALGAEPARLQPLLEKALQDPAPEVRRAGLAGLVTQGDPARFGAAPLLDLLANETGPVRVVAIKALGRLGAKGAPAVPVLTGLLSDLQLRGEAIAALGKIGPPSAPAVTQLLQIGKTGGAEVQATVLSALAGIGPAATAALPMVRTGLADKDPRVRAAAAQALARIEKDPLKTPAALMPLLRDERPAVRSSVALALAQFGEKAGDARPILLNMLKQEDDRAVALEALKAIGVTSVTDLNQAGIIKDSAVRLYVCAQLAQLGPQAREALPRLRAFTRDDDPRVRDAAKAAMAKVEAAPSTPQP